MPNRDRAPQEVTPVRLQAASALPSVGPLASAGDRPTYRHPPPPAAEPPPSRDEIERDVAVVRRRVAATSLYAAGSVALASMAGVAGFRSWTAIALSAGALAAFSGLATLAGTCWTWMGARRLGDAGISVFDALGGSWRDAAPQQPDAARPRQVPQEGARRRDVPRLGPAAHRVPASAEVLASRWGAHVTRAVDDRASIAHLVGGLGPADRDMIPDVLPTADTLLHRVGELATTLHELDRDAPPSLVAEVEARLARSREGAEPERERRAELLERQLETLTDLARRRETLAERLEGAALLLQNMRLDLLRLRSAGIESALGELETRSRDAGALSRDIARALDVAEELRGE